MSEKVRRKKVPIVIPGAEFMTPEELKRAKKNEAQRRLMARRRGHEPTEVKETKQTLRIKDTEALLSATLDARNMTAEVLHNKLNLLLSDEEELRKVNLVHLTTAFGTLVDKAQLLSGLATEHIAISAKIDINMSADKAMEELNKMRETYAESNG